MIALNKNAFRLPRVEKEKFIQLLRLGLEYDRSQGTFKINNYNNIEKLIDTLSTLFDSDKVMFLQTCIICSKDFQCEGCTYHDLCPSRNLPFSCVCQQCLKAGKTIQEK
jgi:hypothetical protein